MIEPGVWADYYQRWGVARGNPIRAKPVRFIGMKGWDNWIEKKVVDGVTYAAEVWECETEDRCTQNCLFRIPYDEMPSDIIYRPFERQLPDYANAHFDGLEAYLTGEITKKGRTLLKTERERLAKKIQALYTYFKELNNIEHQQLKLGVQLYLARLETPTRETSRQWKSFSMEHPYSKSQIIDHLREIGCMTSNA